MAYTTNNNNSVYKPMNKISSAINFVRRAKKPFDYKTYFNKCSLNKIACIRCTLEKAQKHQDNRKKYNLYKCALAKSAINYTKRCNGFIKNAAPGDITPAQERELLRLQYSPKNPTQVYPRAKDYEINTNREYYTPNQLGVLAPWEQPENYGRGLYWGGPYGLPSTHVRPVNKWKLHNILGLPDMAPVPGAPGAFKTFNPYSGEPYVDVHENPTPTPIPELQDWYKSIDSQIKRKAQQPNATPADKARAQALYEGQTLGKDFAGKTEQRVGEGMGKWDWNGEVDLNRLPRSSQLYSNPAVVERDVINAIVNDAMNKELSSVYNGKSPFQVSPDGEVVRNFDERAIVAPKSIDVDKEKIAAGRTHMLNQINNPTQEMVDAIVQRINKGTASPTDLAIYKGLLWKQQSNAIAEDANLMRVYLQLANGNPDEIIDPNLQLAGESGFRDPFKHQYKTIAQFMQDYDKAYDRSGNITPFGKELQQQGYPLPDTDVRTLNVSPDLNYMTDFGGNKIGTRWGYYKKDKTPIFEFTTGQDSLADDVFSVPSSKHIDPDDKEAPAVRLDGKVIIPYTDEALKNLSGEDWVYRQIANSPVPTSVGWGASIVDLAMPFRSGRGYVGKIGNKFTPARGRFAVKHPFWSNVFKYGGNVAEPLAVGSAANYATARAIEQMNLPTVKENMVYKVLQHHAAQQYIKLHHRSPFFADNIPTESVTSPKLSITAPSAGSPTVFGTSAIDTKGPGSGATRAPLVPRTPYIFGEDPDVSDDLPPK